MTPYQKLWNGMNFRSKMIISYFVIALIPLLLFSVVIGSVLVSDARQTAYLHTSQVVNQVSESLDVYIANVEKLIDYVIVAQSHTENQAEPQNATEAMLEDLLRASSEIAGIMIAYDDDSCVGSGMSRTSRDLFADEQWYHLAKQRSGSLGIISTAVGRNVVTNVNYSADTIFSLVKSFPATPQHKGGVVKDQAVPIAEGDPFACNHVAVGGWIGQRTINPHLSGFPRLFFNLQLFQAG